MRTYRDLPLHELKSCSVSKVPSIGRNIHDRMRIQGCAKSAYIDKQLSNARRVDVSNGGGDFDEDGAARLVSRRADEGRRGKTGDGIRPEAKKISFGPDRGSGQHQVRCRLRV